MLDLIICSAERKIFQGEIEAVYVPAKQGDFQILSGHAPLLAVLDKGNVRIRTQREEKNFSIEDGFIEVHNNEVTLLIK